MSQSYCFNTTLHRSSITTPWGFRLEGGKEYGTPLIIQRVFQGSAASGDLQRGDAILSIQQRDVKNMYHNEALELLERAGATLQLSVRRGLPYGSDNAAYWSPNDVYQQVFNPPPAPRPQPLYNYAPQSYVGKYSSHLNNRAATTSIFDVEDPSSLVRNRVIEKARNPRPVLSQTGSPMLPVTSSSTLPRGFSRKTFHTKPIPIIETVQPVFKYQEKQLVDRLYDSLQKAVNNKPLPVPQYEQNNAAQLYSAYNNNNTNSNVYEQDLENWSPIHVSDRVQTLNSSPRHKIRKSHNSFEFEDYTPPPWKGTLNSSDSRNYQQHHHHHHHQHQQPQPKVIYSKHEASDYSAAPPQLQVFNKQYNTPIGLYSKSTLTEEVHKQLGGPFGNTGNFNLLPSSDF